ncbi:MAG: hypothetical protein WCQ75_04180 [Bacilli bacterium]
MDKKEIRKNFDGLTDDVLDNYEKYEINDRVAIKTQIEKFKELNNLLKIYDIKMEKEEIKTVLNNLIVDILDNYDDYSQVHKDMVKQQLLSYEQLNYMLDKYDNPKTVEKKKSLWEKIKSLFKWS